MRSFDWTSTWPGSKQTPCPSFIRPTPRSTSRPVARQSLAVPILNDLKAWLDARNGVTEIGGRGRGSVRGTPIAEPVKESETAPREWTDEEKLRGFQACLADLQSNGVYCEGPDGSWQLWPELSPEGKLHYIARDATLNDVPFDRFAEAARDLLPPADLADAALRVTLSHQTELHQLAALLPDDRGTESTPLVDRLKEVLRDHPDRAGAEREHNGGIER